MVSHGNLMRHCAQIEAAWGYAPGGASLTWVPHFHDYGLVDGLILPLYVGIPCYTMAPTAFYMRPLRWLQAISRYRVTHTQGPNSGYEHCLRRVRTQDLAGLDLRCWRTASDGGEPVRPDTVRGFVAALAPYGFRREALTRPSAWRRPPFSSRPSATSRCPSFSLLDAAALEKHAVVEVPPGRVRGVREGHELRPADRQPEDRDREPRDATRVRARQRRRDLGLGPAWPSATGRTLRRRRAPSRPDWRRAATAVHAHRGPGLPQRRRARRHRPAQGRDHHPGPQSLSAGHRADGGDEPSGASARSRRGLRAGAGGRRTAGRRSGGRSAASCGAWWPRTSWPTSARPSRRRTSSRPMPSCFAGPERSPRPRAARSGGRRAARSSWKEALELLGDDIRTASDGEAANSAEGPCGSVST